MIRSLWIFGLTLVFVYAGIVYGMIHLFVDAIFDRRLTIELDGLLERNGGSIGPETPLPDTPFFKGYLGFETLPADLRTELEGAGDGLHEIPDGLPREYHVAIETLPGSGRQLILTYDVTDIDTELGLTPALLALVVGLVAILPLGIWWGHRLASSIARPISDLAAAVERSPVDALASASPVGLAGPGPHPREVEVLATSLGNAMQRVNAFVDRERRFTRNASHELRTPITVIRSSVELLEPHLPKGDDRARRQLHRMARSVSRMEEIVEAFLWLAREAEGQDHGEPSRLEETVPEVVEQHRHLLRDKPVEVRLELDPGLSIDAPEPVLAIVVGNLVANAFYNTARGSVTIVIDGETLRIEDTGRGLGDVPSGSLTEAFVTSREGEGHGLGLAIVEEICSRFGWRLTLSSRDGGGAVATLDLSGPHSPRSKTLP